MQNDKQHSQEDGSNQPEHFHPAWHAWGRATADSHSVITVGVERWVSHVCRPVSRSRQGEPNTILRYTTSTFKSLRLDTVVTYTEAMPKLWNETIEAHRREVRDATLDTTAALVAQHGLRSVTMSQIAEKTGIGRATLYKYFTNVEAILRAWHERQIRGHLEYLAKVRDQAGDTREGLEAVLEAYALISHEHRRRHAAELAAFLHRGKQVARAEARVHDMIRDLLVKGTKAGAIRDDVAPDELANYCLHALSAASTLPSKVAVRRLVTVTLAGLRPPR